MNVEYDPRLQALFAEAEQAFDPEAFTTEIMARINRDRRRMLVLWSSIGAATLVVLALLATPVFTAIGMATALLPASLVQIETDWLRQLLSPINSVAAAVALGALLLRRFYRHIFR